MYHTMILHNSCIVKHDTSVLSRLTADRYLSERQRYQKKSAAEDLAKANSSLVGGTVAGLPTREAGDLRMP